jgi:hypothetical protein
MPKLSEAFRNPVQFVSDLGSTVDDAVNKLPGGWTLPALVAAGYYYYPEISAYVAADGAAVPATGSLAPVVDAGGATEILAPAAKSASSLSALQMANLAKVGISLAGIAGGAKAISNMSNTGGGGLLSTQQDRSGFSSGSANYSPEYYAAVQAQANRYTPQGAAPANITTDLKNWYETKYTPSANVAGVPTTTTTGTGYTTPTTMANLGMQPQTMLPRATELLPSVKSLTSTSNTTDVAKAFGDFAAANGGNTEANRSTAITYLRSIGIPDSAIQSGYGSYLSSLPASTGNTATTLSPNASAEQVGQAYGAFAQAAGGDTEANRSQAITYLRRLGIPDATIQAAYPAYKASLTSAQAGAPTGMLTGGTAPMAQAPAAQAPMVQQQQPQVAPAAQPLYSTLSAASNPQAIADAYQQFLGNQANDTDFNRQAANKYLTNLGISQADIGQAYGLFKG